MKWTDIDTMDNLSKQQLNNLESLHINNFYTPEELSDKFNIPEYKIRKYLVDRGIYKINEFNFQSEKHQIAIDLNYKNIHECIVSEYKKLKSARKVADIMKTGQDTILIYLRKHNIKLNPKGGPHSQKLSPDQIKQIISRFGESTKVLAKEFGVAQGTINKYHRTAGFKKAKHWRKQNK